LKRKNLKKKNNSTINFPPLTQRMEARAHFTSVIKRQTIAKKMKSSHQLRSRLLQEVNQVFNLVDSHIINNALLNIFKTSCQQSEPSPTALDDG
jgi:hypothetical protein